MKNKWLKRVCAVLSMTLLLGQTVPAMATAADDEVIIMEDEDAADDEAVDVYVESDESDLAESDEEIEAEQQTQEQPQEQLQESVVSDEEIAGAVTVERDEADDQVTITSKDRPYLALGADLTDAQRNTVLSLLKVDPARLSEYDVVYVNNAEEHKYLDAYIDSSKIGTKSLSSIVIVKREKGNGINISTNNISYCTVGMYKNALATAGITDADIIVAGPCALSGTAALVGVFKAYTQMTGNTVDEQNIDAALNELVVTGDIINGSDVDSEDVEALIAYVKQAVVEHDMSDETEIRKAIDEGCEKFEVTLTEEEKAQIVALMKKIDSLNLDIDTLLNSAQSIYDKISNGEDVSGIFGKIGNWLGGLFSKILSIFSK